MELKQVEFETMCRGAIKERFDDALKDVLGDILDVNSDPTKMRVISIKIAIKPDLSREKVQYAVDVTVKKPNLPLIGSTIYIGREKGEIVAFEYEPAELPFGDNVIKL
jgi:hypothetical protein